MKVEKPKINIYTVVFGTILLFILAAALSTLLFNKNLAPSSISIQNLTSYGQAAGISGISAWINSPPLNISKLKGKVVIVDFWTYSCINCIRSIPHLNAWYNAYGNNGLVIIGVHTPEFQFEHNYSNVYAAVQRFGIKYPVALDNNYSTWDAYGNEYWPADYLIDKNGTIRYEIFGEGNYNTTELVIRELLQNAGYVVQRNLTSVALGVNFSQQQTPELYLGWQKARQPIGNPEGFSPNKTVNYAPPNISLENVVYFSGKWYNAPDSMIAVNNSKLYLIYRSDKVNIVAGAQGLSSANITVKLDGKSVNQSYLGADDHVVNSNAISNIGANRLYNIVASSTYSWHILEIDANQGFRIYTFTFG